MALAARLQLDARVDEPLAAHPLADARLLVELGDVVLEDTRPDPRLDVVAASVLEDDRVDPGDVEQLGQRQARRACSDDRDLRLRHEAPRSNRAAWPWPTPTHIVAIPYRPAAATELVEQRHDEPRTAHPERVADRDRAAVDVHALLVDPEVAHHRERLRGERLVQLDEVDVLDRDPRAVEQLADGRDRPDAHHGGIDARDGRADEGPERLDAEIPGALLAGDHECGGAVVDPARVPGRHGAVLAERGSQARELLGGRVRPRVLVVLELAGGDQLVGEAALRLRGCPALLRTERERVLILARDVPALRDVLARLPHRLAREPLLVAGVDEPPAERRVVDRPVAAREGRVGLRGDERRAGHRLDAAGDEEVAVAGDHGMAGADDRGEPRCAEPIDGDARDRVRQAREQRGEAGDVAVVLARLVRAAEPDVLDLLRGDSRALDGSRDRERRKVVGPHGGEPAAVAADRRAHRRQDDRPGHCASSSSITRCAIAKAPFAAGTPQ